MPIQVDIALDPLTGDLAHPTRLITGMELIQQRIRLRLRRGTGEWFLDPSVGLPLLDWRQQKPPRVADIVARIQAEIREVPGVTGTSNFTGEHDPLLRKLTVTGDVFAADGEVTSIVVMGSADPARNVMPFAVFFASRSIQGLPAAPFAGRP